MRQRMTGRNRLAASLAAIAVLAAAGCGAESNEPTEKDWDEGSKSEQQSGSNDKPNDDGKDSSDQEQDKDGDGKVKRRAGDEDPLRPDKATAAEAEAFISDYLDALNAATKDGDFSRTGPMIEDCDVCEGSRSQIEPVYQDGGKVNGGLFTEPKIRATWKKDGEVGVDVVSTVSAYEITDKAGTTVDDGPAEEQSYQFSVAKKDGDWEITSGRFVK